MQSCHNTVSCLEEKIQPPTDLLYFKHTVWTLHLAAQIHVGLITHTAPLTSNVMLHLHIVTENIILSPWRIFIQIGCIKIC